MARFGVVACPDAEVLSAFSRGRLEPSRRSEIETHLDECEGCCQVVSNLVRVYATADRSGDSVSPPPAGAEETLVDDDVPPERDERDRGSRLEPGARLDRYYILEAVGAGGMGVVYAAYDADLDRKVALKVLHEHGSRDDRAQRRLVREAQAMARLPHPNVITVHEVRELEHRVFISMEFVEGGTLQQWLTREQPDQARILEMFRSIGQGLIAAHAAGLVHRDIKPDNVLIGTDERPRVTDFGLARPSDDDLEASGGSRDSLRPSTPTDPGLAQRLDPQPFDDLTRTGALVGTPAYMAPEQFRRQATTAASDQFSFCVALYEALYGQRPFAGRALPELAANVLSESILEPKDDHGVPRWLRQVIRRGLSLEPSERWSSMEELVAQLEPTPPRTRRRLAIAGVTIAALAVGGTLATRSLSASDPCDRGRRSMNELWTQGARSDVADALSEGSSKYAHDTSELAVRRIDAYVDAWTTAHRNTCEGYQRGELSDEALDLRGACLDDRRRELSALVGVLAQPDPAARRHAVEAIDGLPGVASCGDMKALRARVPRPRDPQVLTRVQKIEHELARARALDHAGQYDAGFVVADQAVRSARKVGHAPVLADALRTRANLQKMRLNHEATAADLLEAWQVALGAGDDTSATEVIVEYIKVVGGGMSQIEKAEARYGDARAMLDRLRRYDATRADELDGEFSYSRGTIEMRKHRYDVALELFHDALQRAEQRFGPDGLGTASVLSATAGAHLAKKRWVDALTVYERVLEINIEHRGPTHPEVGNALNNVGLGLKHLGRYDESVETFLRAREVLAYSLAPDHPGFSMVDINLAEVYFALDRYADAVEHYDPHMKDRTGAEIPHAYFLRRMTHYVYALARVERYDDVRRLAAVLLERSEQLDNAGTRRIMLATLAFVDVAEGRYDSALSRIDQVPTKDTLTDAIDADVLLIRGRALLGRGDPGATETATKLLAQVQAIEDPVIIPVDRDIQYLIDALAAHDSGSEPSPSP